MMRRVELLIGRNIAGLFGGTFHHVANLLLRQHYQLAGYKQGFSILDREDSKELFESCIAAVFRKERVIPKGAVSGRDMQSGEEYRSRGGRCRPAEISAFC